MNEAIVVRGRYAGKIFLPNEPMPNVEGAAELIVFPCEKAPSFAQPQSIFALFGKAPILRSAEDIENQIREEREAWGEE